MASPINQDYEQGGIFGGMSEADEKSYGVNYDPKPMNNAETYSVANAGIQIVSSILASQLQTEAFEAKLEADTHARIANINNELNSYELNAYKLEEDLNRLDDAFANKVSDRALKSMKDFATAKAIMAETGTYGGSSNESAVDIFSDEMMDLAIINHQRKNALIDVSRRQEQAKQNAVNAFKTLASGGVNYKANAILSGVAGSVDTLGNLLSSMPKSVSSDIFGMDTKANKIDISNNKGD